MGRAVTTTTDAHGQLQAVRPPGRRLPAGLLVSPQMAEAVEAVARMLPTRLPGGGAYGVVARAALEAALPHLVKLLAPPPGDLRTALLELHYPHDPWTGGLPVCHHDDRPWPCQTAQLCAR